MYIFLHKGKIIITITENGDYMAIDAMEEIIIYEEKAKKIKEDSKIFAKEIYEKIISAATEEAAKQEKEYKDKLLKEHEELKEKYINLLKEHENYVKSEANTLLNNLLKNKTELAKSLVAYILDKE